MKNVAKLRHVNDNFSLLTALGDVHHVCVPEAYLVQQAKSISHIKQWELDLDSDSCIKVRKGHLASMWQISRIISLSSSN